MKYLLIFIILISAALAEDIEKRRNQILKIVDEEIGEVQRLMRTTKKDPELMLRMAELYLEKARLWRERENQQYLKVDPAERRKVKKSTFFKESNKYFNQANALCLEIVSRFKTYRRVGEAYYILGFNAKEANKQKEASKYLGLATKKTRDPETKNKTKITLAEVYYNQKLYKKAIPLYESALKKPSDKWWTKDAYNLAWSYYQIGQSSKAISLMKTVYERSEDKKFIDMRDDVKRDIGLFYATSGQIDEGMKFYRTIGSDFSGRLIFIAGTLMQQGQFQRAEKVYNEAFKYEKDEAKKIEILVEKLVLYEKSSSMSGHFLTARELFKFYKMNKLKEEHVKIYKFQLEKVAAILQRQVIANTYERLPKKRIEKATQANEYFEYLSHIDKNKSDEYKYLKAETAFAAKLNTDAYSYYKDAFMVSDKIPNSKFKAKSIEGMLATISLKENKNSKNNIETFELFLGSWPNGKKAQGIYPRLFNNYLDQNDYASAKKTLDRYTKNYPDDYKTQEAMIAKLMDIDRKKKDNDSLRNWISQIDQKKYKVSGKFQTKLKELLTTLQIEDVQKDLNKGNKKNALVGYMAILEDPYSTKRSKINAKYNLSALYYELNDTENAYKWSIEALKEMESGDVIQFMDSFITIANYLFTSLEFSKSANLSENLIYKICSQNAGKKDVSFKNAIFIYLADGDIESAERLLEKANSCKIKTTSIDLARFEVMREYKNQKRWQEYEKAVLELSNSKSYKSKMIDEYLFLANLQKNFSNTARESEFRKKAKDLYYYAKSKKESVSMEALDYFAYSLIIKMQNTAAEIEKITYAFPEKVFQQRQQNKLKLLEVLTSQASEIQAVGSGVGIVNSFKILHDAYLGVAKDLFSFTPPDKSPEYIAAFKKDMNTLGEQIKQAAMQYKSEASRAIKENEILSTNNFYFQKNSFPVRYLGEGEALIMDRGGK